MRYYDWDGGPTALRAWGLKLESVRSMTAHIATHSTHRAYRGHIGLMAGAAHIKKEGQGSQDVTTPPPPPGKTTILTSSDSSQNFAI